MCLTALNSNGQYQFLLKGQKSPFDTAVAVRIDRYRIEGKKLKLSAILVDSMLLEIKGLHREVFLGDSLNRIATQQLLLLTVANTRKDSVITRLHADITKMAEDPPGHPFSFKTDFLQKPDRIGLLVLIIIEGIRLSTGK